MESVINKAQTIDKSIIHGFPFVKEDVLNEEKALKERQLKLTRAMQLGNLHKHHVRLKFYDKDKKYYETVATVWAVTEKYVHLKGGAVIPIHSIFEIELA